jgi:hypothetical protein
MTNRVAGIPRCGAWCVAVLAAWSAVASGGPAEGPEDIVSRLAERAGDAGERRLSETIAAWELPEPGDRILVLRIDATTGGRGWTDPPEWVRGEEASRLWREFVEARRARAERLVGRALESVRGGEPQGGSAAAMPLLFRALREDPDHAEARAAVGWRRRDGRWVWPEAARRMERGEVFSERFGWMSKSRLSRFENGERYDRGRWIDATEAERPRSVDRAWKTASDHWEIDSTVPMERAMALAVVLEETRMAWLQAFGGFAIDAGQIVGRAAGRAHAEPRRPFAATLVRDRAEYAAALLPLEPAAGRTLGLYWNPTRTAWFFDTDDEGRAVGPARTTVLHEATHQLFSESRDASPLAGERSGFWALEAVACFMESLEPAPFGWMLGGPTAGRVPVARERLVEDGFHVPLRELSAMGRARLQADDRLPMIYSEISGLADFFLCGRQGLRRGAFLEYLRRIYDGTAEPGTLAELCGASFEELDDDYRRFMAAHAVGPPR